SLQLKRGLLRRQQDQRQTFRRLQQFGANFAEAAMRFAAAGRAEEEARLHETFLSAARERLKETKYNYSPGWTAFVPGSLLPSPHMKDLSGSQRQDGAPGDDRFSDEIRGFVDLRMHA